ncbi:hypothetical protein D3H65_28955 [Paraflavitalea soli]|uniref:Uncharacterized protein n=1 Tax=Paraflavitalea soli TaxID=2315862 RepID=A0A3B7MUJ6_9BACT|nr:hypothetical protein D3H65_28955 [Paraflavitalea soli]
MDKIVSFWEFISRLRVTTHFRDPEWEIFLRIIKKQTPGTSELDHRRVTLKLRGKRYKGNKASRQQRHRGNKNNETTEKARRSSEAGIPGVIIIN